LVDPGGNLVVAEFFGFEIDGFFLNFLGFWGAPVGFGIFVIDDQDGGFHGGLQVFDQQFEVLPCLGFLDDNHLVVGHHGISAGGFDDGGEIGILAVKNSLVETLLRFRQQVVLDIVGNHVGVIRFFPAQKIDRMVDFVFKAGQNLFVFHVRI